MKTPTKPRRGKVCAGAKDGKPFGTEQAQPSPEAKSAGWLRKRQLRELLKMQITGKAPAAEMVKRFVASYLGVAESDVKDELTLEVAMDLRQIEKAITKGDTKAYEVVKDRVYGKPKVTVAGDQQNPLTINITVKQE